LIRPGASYRFIDTAITPGLTYFYRLEALDRTGNREFFGPVSARIKPENSTQPVLGLAFPNPLHEGVSTIPFTLAAPGEVRIRVLDLEGREIRVLLDKALEAGEQSVNWDGRSQAGENVSAGIYLYELETPGLKATRKLVRLR